MLSSNDSFISDRHPLLSLLLILVTIAVGFTFVGPMIGLAIGSFFYEGNLMEAIASTKADEQLFIPMMIVQGTATLVGLIIAPMAHVAFIEHKPVSRLFQPETDVRVYLSLVILAFGFMIAITPVVDWNAHVEFPESMRAFGDWARQREDQLSELTKSLTQFQSTGHFLIGLLVIAVLPAIGEELCFRGLIQNELFRAGKNIHLAIWASAILFSAIHMQFFGFVPRMLLGAFFGYLYYWSGNLTIPIVAHFLHNGLTLTSLYLYQQGTIEMNPDTEESAPWPLVGTAAVITFTLLYFLYHTFQKKTATP